jgi:hypothetical protein
VPINYYRQPIIPEDQEGKWRYVAQELDKISLTFQSLDFDNLTPEAQQDIITNVTEEITNILEEAEVEFQWPPGKRLDQLMRFGTGQNDVRFHRRDAYTFIQDTQPTDEESLEGDFWVKFKAGYKCDSYQSGLAASGADGIWLANDATEYVADQDLTNIRNPSLWSMQSVATINTAQATGQALLPTTCAVEYSIDNPSDASSLVQSSSTFTAPPVFCFSYLCKANTGVGYCGFQLRFRSLDVLTVSFGDTTSSENDIELGFQIGDGVNSNIVLEDFRTTGEICVITVMWNNTTKTFKVLKNWQDYTVDPLKIFSISEITLDPNGFFEGTTTNDFRSPIGDQYLRTIREAFQSHLAWWENKWPTDSEIVALDQAYRAQDQTTAPSSDEVGDFLVKMPDGTWYSLLGPGGTGILIEGAQSEQVVWDETLGQWVGNQRDSRTFVQVGQPVDGDIVGGILDGDAWVENYN